VDASNIVEVESGDNMEGSVIWLHGLGADGHDFEPIVPELRLPADLGLRFVFPHAPVRPVTLNGGMSMRAWFDIVSLDRNGPVDEAGIRQSASVLDALIEREHQRGIAYEKIVLAGFSQGGAIASHCALRHTQKLGGLMALSTYVPMLGALQAEVAEVKTSQSRSLPIFMAHGSFDPVLPIQLGTASRDALRALGFTVEWHEYPIPHSVCAEEISDISRWLVSSYR